jgi:hypothetical protein
VLRELIAEGYPVKRDDVAALSPYLTTTYQEIRRLFHRSECASATIIGKRFIAAALNRKGRWPKLCPIFTRLSHEPGYATSKILHPSKSSAPRTLTGKSSLDYMA